MMLSDKYILNLKSFLGAVKVDFHKHLVYPTNISTECDACSNYEPRASGEGGYICKPCNLYVHKDCIEINDPYRHKHPLKLLQFSYDHDYDKECSLCEQMVERFFYHCFLCDLTLCKLCPSKPLVIEDIPKKVHKHSLTQVMIEVSFTCDACGVSKDGLPCVCLQCCFIIHRSCIKLPRVIYINRHNHRVSHSYSLGPGAWICGVCRKSIDRRYGAYSCSVCHFAVHSRCATREDVWDGEELEDVSDNEDEDLDPFEVIGEGLIKHFSHEHDLRLIIGGSDGNKHYCNACTLPIFFDPCYICIECGFVLHETCANLPRKIRHEIHSHQLTLCVNSKGSDEDALYFFCRACDRLCTGFYYEYEGTRIDIRCAKVSNELNHESHTHPLFCISTEPKLCRACGDPYKPVMSCIECEFDLCFYCATLPQKVRHMYDRHPLSLCFGENAVIGVYWCEVCEGDVEPNEWFYTCDDCCSTFHIKCVLGSYLHVRPGHIFIIDDKELEVVANDRPNRPVCSLSWWRERCVQPFVLKGEEDHKKYLCGCQCMRSLVLIKIYGLSVSGT